MEEEIWVDIKGFEGLYQVSNLGNVKGLHRRIKRSDGKYNVVNGRYIKIQYNKRTNVYEVHLINKESKRKCIKLHRLVAENFVYNDNTDIKVTVNHIDGDRSNNKASNLEWCSYSENLQHAYDVLKRPVNSNKIKHRNCKSINKETQEVKHYHSIAEASRNTGVSETQIRRIINKECINKKYEFYYT